MIADMTGMIRIKKLYNSVRKVHNCVNFLLIQMAAIAVLNLVVIDRTI